MPLRRLLPALSILALSACAHTGVTRWAGDYEAGVRRLQLRSTGEFDYDGGSCFHDHSDSDVGFADAFSGRFRVEGRWIVLEPAGIGYIEHCSSITLKLYAHSAEGRRYLFEERYLRGIAHDVRRGAPPDRYYPWHIAGEPGEFSAAALDWLPPPFAHWAAMPPPAGRVVAIGPVQQRTRYGSAGRVEGEESFAMLTLDFGRRQGAFEGLPVCVPGRERRYWLEAAAEDTSTLRWSWPATGDGAPEVGMRVESACR
jgi:hypothetical protein